MTRVYLDTSAALKLLVEEAESDALADHLDAEQPLLVASWLLETELRRAAQRHGALSQRSVSAVLDAVDLYEVTPSLFREAGVLPGPSLRSLDALHLAAALRIGVDSVMTYDERMTAAAQELGLTTQAPGR